MLVQQQRDARDARHGADRQGRPRDAVDAPIEFLVGAEARVNELLGEKRVAHLPAAAFTKFEDAYVADSVIGNSLPISSRIHALFSPSCQ